MEDPGSSWNFGVTALKSPGSHTNRGPQARGADPPVDDFFGHQLTRSNAIWKMEKPQVEID